MPMLTLGSTAALRWGWIDPPFVLDGPINGERFRAWVELTFGVAGEDVRAREEGGEIVDASRLEDDHGAP